MHIKVKFLKSDLYEILKGLELENDDDQNLITKEFDIQEKKSIFNFLSTSGAVKDWDIVKESKPILRTPISTPKEFSGIIQVTPSDPKEYLESVYGKVPRGIDVLQVIQILIDTLHSHPRFIYGVRVFKDLIVPSVHSITKPTNLQIALSSFISGYLDISNDPWFDLTEAFKKHWNTLGSCSDIKDALSIIFDDKTVRNVIV